MYGQSIPAIISKNVGNTLTNYQTWGGILYNVKSYGAKGDLNTDDTAAIQAAYTAASNAKGILYFPPGYYKITSTLIGTTAIQGVYGKSFLYTNVNIPMIQIDVNTASQYYLSIDNMSFIGDITTGLRTSNAGILITGSGNFYLNQSKFTNLLFLGTYYGIRSTKSSNLGGGENGINFNLFNNLTFTNYGANNCQYGIKFDYGSGTGNIFSNSTIGAIQSCIEIGGNGALNIGDITIANIQFASAQNAINLIGSATAYTSNVSVTGCQFDAGIITSLNFTNMDRITAQGCNWGGGTVTNLVNCTNIRVDGMDNLSSEYGSTATNVGIGATVTIGTLTLKGDYNACVLLEIVSFGMQQGIGGAITTSRYHITTDTATASPGLLETKQNGAALLTHSITVVGNVATLKVATNGSAGNSTIKSNVRIIGDKYKYQ